MPFLPFRPWLRRLLIALGAMLLLGGLAMWWLPRWVAGTGMQLAGEALGRPVSVGAVSLQPWRLGLALRDLRVAGSVATAPPLLEVRELDLAVSLRSLWHRSLVLESLAIRGPTLRLARLSEGQYDIDDLLKRWSSPADSAQTDEAPAFALYNLRLAEGQILLDDRPYGRRHSLSALHLELPFLSRLDTHVTVQVQPLLSGELNGQAFSFGGEVLPFAQTREAALEFKLSALDLQPYLAYWPRQLPLKPVRGQLDADLRLVFAQTPAKPAELRLSGRLGLREVALRQGESLEDWLAWQDLQLNLKELQPLQRRLLIDELVWTAPRLALRRDASGRMLLPAKPEAAAETKPAKPSPAWQLALQRFELRQASLGWQDAGPRVALDLKELGLELKDLHWPLQGAATLKFGAQLQGPGQAAAARLDGSGSLSPQALTLDASWHGLALEWLSPYLQAQVPLAVQGRLAGGLGLSLREPLAPRPEERLQARLQQLRLDGLHAQQLVAGEQREELLRLTRLSLDQALLDPAARRLELGQLNLQAPLLQLRRTAAGRWSALDLLPSAGDGSKGEPAAVPAWALSLAGLAVDQGALQLSDAAVRPLAHRDGEAADAPYRLVVEQLRLRAQNLAPGSAALSPLQLSLQLGRPAAAGRQFAPRAGRPRGASGLGSLQWQGELGLAPLAARGSLRAERLPLQALDPYLDPALGLHLRRAEAGFRGEVSLAQAGEGLRAQARGELLLADLRLLQTRAREGGTHEIGEELLSWQALNVAGLRAELQPGQPPRLEVGRAALSDFYARLIVDEQGRFNLRDLGPQDGAQAAERAEQAHTRQAAEGPALLLKLGEATLSQGQVDFSDRFVRPNYSARLSELEGRLGAFETGSDALAPLALKGRVAGTGLLDISGRLKPGSPPVLDIRASASDIELAPLSPYAGKYAGYAIERGKLSTLLHYRVEPGGQLQAENQIVLNQLTFGDKIDSPDATKLPVLLAVALLKDSQGVIDVNLPVSGSLNDPEFSIGGLVFRLIVNLLGKALTSPFSLLAGGGNSDLSHAEFPPASVALEAPALANLDKVAKALADRPGLNLTLTGWADPRAERAALQAARVEQALLAERRRELRRQQNASGSAPAADAPLSAAERQRLLRVVYQNSNLPDRPRNLIGLLKDLPAEQMQAMLAAGQPVDEEAVRQLALQRAVTVRDALLARGVPNARLFLASPRLRAGEAQAELKPWSPRVDLALTAQ